MTNLQVPTLADIGAAALRWHEVNLARRAAAGKHRQAREHARGQSRFDAIVEVERVADKVHADARGAERAARRTLEKLCAAHVKGIVVNARTREIVDVPALLVVEA